MLWDLPLQTYDDNFTLNEILKRSSYAKHSIQHYTPYCASQHNTRTLKFKSQLRLRFHYHPSYYDGNQRTLKKVKQGSKSTNHKLLFPETSAKVIDSSETGNR